MARNARAGHRQSGLNLLCRVQNGYRLQKACDTRTVVPAQVKYEGQARQFEWLTEAPSAREQLKVVQDRGIVIVAIDPDSTETLSPVSVRSRWRVNSDDRQKAFFDLPAIVRKV